MWPLLPELLTRDVNGQVTLLFASAIAVVLVLDVFLARLGDILRKRRLIRTVMCPENDDRPALVVVDRSLGAADSHVVAHCSRWHDRRLDCGERCLDQLAEA